MDMQKKIDNRLKKVNVPELFFQRFLSPIPSGVSSVVDKLRVVSPTPRGRGLSRVITDITESEWNDLYQRAAKARQVMQGGDRDTDLKPAICAKSLAERMEALGVTNPVTYIPSKSYNRRTEETVAVDTSDNDDAVEAVASEPITIVEADEDELTDEENESLQQTLKQLGF